jgi:hypothetical protein
MANLISIMRSTPWIGAEALHDGHLPFSRSFWKDSSSIVLCISDLIEGSDVESPYVGQNDINEGIHF